MNSLGNALKKENGSLRALTGQGEPGLFTLLGGTSPELDSSGLTTTGGPGQVGGVARLARAYKDVRIAGVASGRAPGPRPPVEGPEDRGKGPGRSGF